jgi:hypothetical protein
MLLKACHIYRPKAALFARSISGFRKRGACVLSGSPRKKTCGRTYRGEQKECWPLRSGNAVCAFGELELSAGILQTIRRGMAGIMSIR